MFFALPNMSSRKVFAVDPWTFVPTVPAEVQRSKDDFKEWYMSPRTEHCHFSAFEGLDPRTRITETDNQPVFVHGIVADYDAPLTEDMMDRLVKRVKWPSRPGPNWVSRTFSGNGRLVWVFRQPALVNSDLASQLLRHLVKELRLVEWLPGFDVSAFTRFTQYYEVGTGWTKLSEDAVEEDIVHRWLFEAGKHVRVREDVTIPLDRVEAEVHKRFPGRWVGAFQEGSRGVRFWDATADNPTGAVVRANGMQCFTGDHKAWMTWKDIFGVDFIKGFEAERIGEARKNVFYDGRGFWVIGSDGNWIPMCKDDYRQRLKVQGFSPKVVGTCSEIDKIEQDIKTNCFVHGALPYIHQPSGLYMANSGKTRMLNIATAKCMNPAPVGSVESWKDGKENKFPWCASFLTSFFDPPSQLDYFLAWLKHFYANGLAQKPRPGQAIVIAGPKGMGKTFMSTGFIAKMVGGFADASDYLVEGSQWSDKVATNPVMCIDDGLAASNNDAHMRFSAMIKKVVANRTLSYNKKYADAGEVSWDGRIVITCNVDPESLRILPNMDLSNGDKISLFKTSDKNMVHLPGYYELQAILDAELPYFCRWLLDWEIPKELIDDDPRFYVKPYHHPELFRSTMTNSSSHTMFELIREYMDLEKTADKTLTVWEGSAANLFRALANFSPEAVRRIDAKVLNRELQKMESLGYGIKRVIRHRTALWQIPVDIREPNSDNTEMKEGN